MFTDCIVRNRGAIAEPWHEFRTEGNRYFVIQIVIAFCSMIIFGGLALIFVFGWYWQNPILPLPYHPLWSRSFSRRGGHRAHHEIHGAGDVSATLRRDGRVSRRLAADRGQPGNLPPFRPLLCRALHRGSDDRLPCRLRHLLHRSFALHRHRHSPAGGNVSLVYPLCFIRQFGDPYDVWAVVRPTEPPPPPTVPPVPPVQDTLPPV